MALAQTLLSPALYETVAQQSSHTFSSITVPSGALGVLFGGYINDSDNETPSLSMTASDAGIQAGLSSAVQVVKGTASAYEQALGVWTFTGNGNASTFTLDGGTGHGRRFVFWPMYFTGASGLRQVKADANAGDVATGPYSMALDQATLPTSIVLGAHIRTLASGLSSSTAGTGWTEVYDVCSDGWLLAHLEQRQAAVSAVDWNELMDSGAWANVPVFVGIEVAASSVAGRLANRRAPLKSLIGGGLA